MFFLLLFKSIKYIPRGHIVLPYSARPSFESRIILARLSKVGHHDGIRCLNLCWLPSGFKTQTNMKNGWPGRLRLHMISRKSGASPGDLPSQSWSLRI